MSSVWIIVIAVIAFAAAYKFYGDFIVKKIFKANPENPVPSAELRDDIDYVPTRKEVLFGHHFASIAGTGPILGPAIAIIWGWVPALVWVVIGSIFAGAVHDFAALIISVRKRGVSIGDLTRSLINPRVHTIFLFVIFFSLWIVVAIFGMIIAIIFQMYPQVVFPVWTQIPLAMTVGWLAYRKKFDITVLSIVAVALMYLSIIIGVRMPISMPAILGMSPMTIWIILLFIYAFVASVLPVWTLLQPRDYINSHQLIIGVVLLVLGVMVARPALVAPALQMTPKGAPPILPLIFTTVACGAISGFHSLVSSGTSSKQLRNESDARFVGFGGMLLEGFLAVLVIVAVAAGIGIYTVGAKGEALRGFAAWNHHYSSWAAIQGLTAKVTAFVNGAANLLASIGIPLKYGYGVIGVFVASFAGTTLDTATRIQRYVLGELAESYNIGVLKKRYPATAFVVIAAMALAFSQGGGKGALMLWPLFGTSNQLLAGLTLLVASVYLMKKKVNTWPTALPMLFMICISGWAMVVNLMRYFSAGRWHLVIVGGLILFLEIWMISEAVIMLRGRR